MIIAAVWLLGFIVYLFCSTSPQQPISDLILAFFMSIVWPITAGLCLLALVVILLLYLLTLPKQLLKHIRKTKL